MKVLFLTDAYPNYVPDLLLHGLRKLLGPAVVDYPKKECLYAGVIGLGICPEDQLAPGWFPPDNGRIDRDDIERKIATDFYDLIIADVRALNSFSKMLVSARSKLAVVDGEDFPVSIRPGNYVVFRRETDGSDYSIPLPMALPEEIHSLITGFDQEEKRFSIGFLGSTQADDRKFFIEKISGWYQDALFATTSIPTADETKPQGRVDRLDYYRLLQSCYFVLSLPGAGYDTFRFWENTAMNCVHIAQAMPLYIPRPFRDGEELLLFDSAEVLRRKIDTLLESDSRYFAIQRSGREHLQQNHFTDARARYFLEKCREAFGS
ncbi:MAG: glycosyltransferase [Desulfobulbus sp.]